MNAVSVEAATRAAADPVDRLALADGLGAEQALLEAVVTGRSAAGLRFWQAGHRALVVPRAVTRVAGFDAASQALARAGFPVMVRDTGGDVVPQSPGVLNLAVAFAVDRGRRCGRSRIDAAYDVLCEPLVRWLRKLGLDAGVGSVAGAFCDGRFNLTIDGRKVAGTAQRWRPAGTGARLAVLAHAALIVDADVAALVDVTNRFYRLCGAPKRCETASHTTLVNELSKIAVTRQVAEDGLTELEHCYRECLLSCEHQFLVTV